VKEQLRLVYYEILQAHKAASLAKKAAKTKEGASKAKDSSSSSGEDDDTESPSADKGKQQADDEQQEAVKLQAAMDRFHPDDLYLYFHFGPSIVGGSNNIYFLKDAAAMQDAAAKSGGGGRGKHRADRQLVMEGEGRAAKVSKAQETLSSKLLSTPSPSPTPTSYTTSFGAKPWALAEQRAKLEKRWQQHDRLLGKTVWRLQFTCCVLLLLSLLSVSLSLLSLSPSLSL
jgi:hypothetical protein